MLYKGYLGMAILGLALLAGAPHLSAGDGGCQMESGKCQMDQDKCKDMCPQMTDSAKTPATSEEVDTLIKQSDKLLAEAEKAKDDKEMKAKCDQALVKHCGKMMQMAQGLVNQCGELLKADHPDTKKITGLNNDANELLEESLGIMEKEGFVMVSEKQEPAPQVQYVCPMGCIEPVDKPGKCSKCGMNLVEKKK